MSNIIVLGAGMVGRAMALDLSKNHQVTSTDFDENSLTKLLKRNSNCRTIKLDVTDHDNLKKVIAPFDLVICAVPGYLGFETLEQIILAGKDVIDISFFPENSLDLQQLASEHQVTAIVDCGVAPGMDNLILGYHNEHMEITDFECLVGGLPKVRKWPFEYKAPFSPVDVIEEYTRPARYVENGHVVIKPALSDVETLQFDRVGTLESFNSDGLRTIIDTMPHIPNMKEKTLRYPGHAAKIRMLLESGFLSEDLIEVQGDKIVPKEFTSKILFDEWKLGEEEAEITVMRVKVKGSKNGETREITYELHDEFDPDTQTSSMARTTGYTATAAANMVLDGLFNEYGVFPPELVGKNEACFHYILKYLQDRGINYAKNEN